MIRDAIRGSRADMNLTRITLFFFIKNDAKFLFFVTLCISK